jgi:hypothetical protein
VALLVNTRLNVAARIGMDQGYHVTLVRGI